MNFVRPSKNLIFALLPLIFISLACSRLAAFKANLFEGDNAEKAVAEIKSKIGKPCKVTEIVIEKDTLTIQAQDPNKPQNLDEYKYVAGFVSGPTPVKLNALNDDLEKSSFPMDEINFAAVPQMIADALKQTAIEGGVVSKLTFQRGFAIVDNNAGSLGSARWNIEITGTRESASATANPSGKVIGVNLSQTSRGANYKVTTKEELEKAQNALREAFGADGKVYKIVVYDKYLFTTMINPKNPKVTDDYKFDLNGLTKGGLVRGSVMGSMQESFPLGDVDLTKVIDYLEKARARTGLSNGTVTSISIQRETKSVMNKEFYNTIDVSLQSGVNTGMVIYDLANGEEVRVYKDGEVVSDKK
jgi:hypothetical protein